jgi:hypothetical protein
MRQSWQSLAYRISASISDSVLRWMRNALSPRRAKTARVIKGLLANPAATSLMAIRAARFMGKP